MDRAQLLTIIDGQQGVSLDETIPDYPLIQIQNEQAKATIALHGGHLVSFTPTGHENLFFTSEKAIFKEGKAIRGGIPVCWPWFSGHPENPDLPAHGFARNRFWELELAETRPDHTLLRFSFPVREEDHQLIGGIASLKIDFIIGSRLEVHLKTRNLGDSSFRIGGALHSYFHLSDIANIEITGLEDTNTFNSINGESQTHHGSLCFDGEYDRVFIPTEATVCIVDKNADRMIRVEKLNSRATCVWNPWIEKSAGVVDLAPDDYKKFVCIEAMNWREDLRKVPPGDTHTLSQIISVESL